MPLSSLQFSLVFFLLSRLYVYHEPLERRTLKGNIRDKTPAGRSLHRREAHHIHSRSGSCKLTTGKGFFPRRPGFSISVRFLRSVLDSVLEPGWKDWTGADGTRPWRILRTRQLHIRDTNTSRGRFLWGAPPAPIAAPAGSVRWAVPCWPILSWLPAPFPFPRSLHSSPKARMRAAFT